MILIEGCLAALVIIILEGINMKKMRLLLVGFAAFSISKCVSAAGHKPVVLPNERGHRTDVFEPGRDEVNPYSADDGTADIIDEKVETEIGREEYRGTKKPPYERAETRVSATKSANPDFDTAVWIEKKKAEDPTFDAALMQSVKLYRGPRVLPLQVDEEESIISAKSDDMRVAGPRYSFEEWRTMRLGSPAVDDSIIRSNHSSTPIRPSRMGNTETKSTSDAKSRSSSASSRSEKRRLAQRKKQRRKAMKALRKALRLRAAQEGHVVYPPRKRVMKVTRPYLAQPSISVLGGKFDDFADRGIITSVRGPE